MAGNVYGNTINYEKTKKRTSIGGGRKKTSSLNKHKRRQSKRKGK